MYDMIFMDPYCTINQRGFSTEKERRYEGLRGRVHRKFEGRNMKRENDVLFSIN